MDDAALERLSREGQLYLSLAEMQTIQAHFRAAGPRSDRRRAGNDRPDLERALQPQDAGRADPLSRPRRRAALRQHAQGDDLRRHAEDSPASWAPTIGASASSRDNAGVVRFDDQYNVVFKVETHNHPSALEPYGGANTGIGGVIRDPLGTGLGAKPICNTDVFCFAPPDTPAESLPPGVLHPRRVMKGVVAGVRDYGNRMGIPTVNGAVYFDPRYLGNPLVYCGNVGLIPARQVVQAAAARRPDRGRRRAHRPRRHSRRHVQLGRADQRERNASPAARCRSATPSPRRCCSTCCWRPATAACTTPITDCGAGGFSSAVGEMGEKIGAEVWLDRAPLKYEGLSYTEIWISEAQERMVLAVPPEKWDELRGAVRSRKASRRRSSASSCRPAGCVLEV